MFRNYFITAIRNILRNKIQSFIQVLSLAIGITAAILIGMYAWHEFTYDNHIDKGDRIYRIQLGDRVGMRSAIGHQIKQEIPEVENVVRLVNWSGKDRVIPVKYMTSSDSTDKKAISIKGFFWCDSTIFDVFAFKFIQGDPETALRDPYTCVLTESTARRIFGSRDPVGEELEQPPGEPLTITGIIEDVKHSHIQINMLISMVSLGAYTDNAEMLNAYDDPSYMTYLLLPEVGDPEWFEKGITDFFTEKWLEEFNYRNEFMFSLLPFKEIYFTTGMDNEKNYCLHGNLKLLKALMAVALLILFLAIINYVNLTTARASLRAREVGIRNIVGATKDRLIFQFLLEAIVVTIISFVIALTIVQLLLPVFNQLAMTELDMEFLSNPATYVWFVFSVIILGVVSGFYPALYLTGIQTTRSLSGAQVTGPGAAIFRRILLAFQFTISIILVIGVGVILRQLHYMKNAELGFNKEFVLHADCLVFQRDLSKRQVFRQELLKNPNVRGVAFSAGMMGQEITKIPGTFEINGTKKQVASMGTNPDFFDVMEIELIDGRKFSWERPGDYGGNIKDNMSRWIVNETFVSEFNIKSPVGFVHTWPTGNIFEIVGVARDFNFNSHHEKIMPMFFIWQEYESTVSIRIAPENIHSTLRYIRNEFLELFPEIYEFDFSFLDETYARQYLKDEKTSRIIFNFAIVAILIACLGLFGLSTFMAARRTKEIGIRKTMGASVKSVFMLLSREFLKWVIISVAIACPVGWYVMNKWLQNFAYSTSISWWIFALAILIAFVIAFGTVTWQSLKTARTNPVEALRYE